MVKDPFKEWDRVDTCCALLVDLGSYNFAVFISSIAIQLQKKSTENSFANSPTICTN